MVQFPYWNLCRYRSGKMSCDWLEKSGKVREFCFGRPVWTLDVLTRHLLVLCKRYWRVYTSFSRGLSTVIQRTGKSLLSVVDDLYTCCPLANDWKNYQLWVYPCNVILACYSSMRAQATAVCEIRRDGWRSKTF